ncbi:MAG: hypothetical protein BWY76_01723 [bacterium ADurb.Bin429]|nr:MAG: hypothetical protein BWY76_01723 [bacterium ADurb.Bin429]
MALYMRRLSISDTGTSPTSAPRVMPCCSATTVSTRQTPRTTSLRSVGS